MRDKKCGRFLAKNNLILCDGCNKILSEWLREKLSEIFCQGTEGN